MNNNTMKLKILRMINAWTQNRINKEKGDLYAKIVTEGQRLAKESKGKTPKDATWGGIFPNGIGNDLK